MWYLLLWPFVELFALLYSADTRPEARRFAIACSVIFAIAIAVVCIVNF